MQILTIGEVNKMAATKRAKITTIDNLIRNLKQFDDLVMQEITLMNKKTDALGESWKDAQYSQFEDFMNELTESVKRDLSAISATAEALEAIRRILVEE